MPTTCGGWRTIEKARKRYGTTESQLTVPPDNRLLKAWDRMTDEDRERLVRIAEQLAKRNPKRIESDELVQLIIVK